MPKDSKKATDYTWASYASWVSVKDGVVKFTGTGTGSKVIITGTPTSGQGKIIKYSFTLKSWFISFGLNAQTWETANEFCSAKSGYSLPAVAELTNNNFQDWLRYQSRAANAGLWSEWGDLSGYPGAGLSGRDYWSSDSKVRHDDDSTYYVVDLNTGSVSSKEGFSTSAEVCRQDL